MKNYKNLVSLIAAGFAVAVFAYPIIHYPMQSAPTTVLPNGVPIDPSRPTHVLATAEKETPAVYFKVDELIPCMVEFWLGQEGREVSQNAKGFIQRLVLSKQTVELRLEQGDSAIGEFEVRKDGLSLGWKRRTADPEGDIYVLGEDDFFFARNETVAECHNKRKEKNTAQARLGN